MGNVMIILILIVLIFVGIRRIYRTARYGGSCCSGSGGMEKKVRVRDRKRRRALDRALPEPFDVRGDKKVYNIIKRWNCLKNADCSAFTVWQENRPEKCT